MGQAAIGDPAEAELVERARAGDRTAFADLVRRHAPIATRMALVWGAGRDADDVVQDALVKAYAALPRFRDDAGFRGWLLSIVRNETRNLFRGRARRTAREEQALVPDELWPADPETEAVEAEQRQRLLAAVRALPAGPREVVCCRYLLELSEAETARALGVPPGTVKSRLHRALAALRKEVGDE